MITLETNNPGILGHWFMVEIVRNPGSKPEIRFTMLDAAGIWVEAIMTRSAFLTTLEEWRRWQPFKGKAAQHSEVFHFRSYAQGRPVTHRAHLRVNDFRQLYRAMSIVKRELI